MKYLIIFSIYLLCFVDGNSQNITLRILGQANYTDYAESNVALISLSNKETIDLLQDSLLSKQIKSKIVEGSILKKNKFIQYKVEENDVNKFDELLSLCVELNIRIDEIYFKMPEHKLEDEDRKAILALENANHKARIIAKHLNYKVANILNIDDETTYSSSLYDNIDFDSEKGQLTIRVLELLSGGRNSIYNIKSKNKTRSGGYNLWVTYNLKKLKIE